MITTDDLIDSVTASYVACALWSSVDDAGEPLGDRYDASDLAPETLRTMREDVADFLALADREGIAWQAAGWSPEQFGHDLWLTRNGHGAGYWDRHYAGPSADVGNQLTTWAKAAGSVDLYIGDDSQVYAG